MHTIGKPKNEAMESSVGQMLANLLSFSMKESSERNELAELFSLQSNKDLQKEMEITLFYLFSKKSIFKRSRNKLTKTGMQY